MAGENDCRTTDVFVLDNAFNDKPYVDMLRDLGYTVEVVTDLRERVKLREFEAKVFIFGYSLESEESYESVRISDETISGIDLAQRYSEWPNAKDKYIHIVSPHADDKQHPLEKLTWERMIKMGLFKSVSDRTSESFEKYLNNIIDAITKN
ncbi:hypothetical protein JW851_01990 [Candidatus Woesearchaeota archaeon]|nr:hypothetical protein [Candidatus Woesearchaeota archaeon]